MSARQKSFTIQRTWRHCVSRTTRNSVTRMSGGTGVRNGNWSNCNQQRSRKRRSGIHRRRSRRFDCHGPFRAIGGASARSRPGVGGVSRILLRREKSVGGNRIRSMLQSVRRRVGWQTDSVATGTEIHCLVAGWLASEIGRTETIPAGSDRMCSQVGKIVIRRLSEIGRAHV